MESNRPTRIRNNNPLNIRRGKAVWIGSKNVRGDRYVTFSSLEYGYRAAWRLMRGYCVHVKVDGKPCTLENLMKRRAKYDGIEDVRGYIDKVSGITGWSPSELMLPMSTAGGKKMFAELIGALTCVECGIESEKIDWPAIARGYSL